MLRKIFFHIFIAAFLLAAPGLRGAGHSVSLKLTHLKCYNICDGKAVASVSGAVGPVVIHWLGNNLPPNTKGDSIVSLCPGNYSVEVIDKSDNSSSGVVNFQILNASPFFYSINTTPVSCYGDSNGVLTINVSGAKPPYKYLWSTSAVDTMNFIDSLKAGSYSVKVTDSNGCVLLDTFTVTQPDSLIAGVTGFDAKCKDQCSGMARALPTGGTFPYDYLWNNADSNSVAENLCDGTYNLIVTDLNGCLAYDTISIGEPDSILTSFIVDSVSCSDSCNGRITPIVNGGIGPYSYSWAPGNSSDSVLMNACVGNYTLTLSDSAGCYLQQNFTIEGPLEISVTDSIDYPDCNTCNGLVKVFPVGGLPPYHYLWNTGNPADTLQTLSGLCSGVYSVTVSDSMGCSFEYTIALSDSSNFTGVSVILSSPLCYASGDGSATVRPIGGTAPFTYNWNPGGLTDSTIKGLSAGVYEVTITDNNGCKQVKEITLNSPDSVQFHATVSKTKCNSSCDGEILLRPSGGTPPYSYYWDETSTTASNISGLCSGWYHGTITDAKGCSFTDSFFVDTATTLMLSVQGFDISCFGSCDGFAVPQVSGGTPPFAYSWSNSSINDTAQGLCAGSYSLIVTDKNGCSASAAVTIGSPSQILSNYTSINSACGLNDGKLFVSPTGGSGAYDIKWFNGTTKDSLVGLTPGFYNVAITDTNGCSASFILPVSSIGGPKLSVTTYDVDCYESCDGSATVSTTSGQGPFKFLWSTGDTTTSVSGLCAGSYFVKVTDGKGCVTVENVIIEENSQIKVDITKNDQSCNGICDGDAIAAVSGGVPPYTFSWQAGGNLNSINNLCPGVQTLTVTDSKNCAVTTQFEIVASKEILVNFNRTNISCENLCDGELEAVVSGGKPPYSYNWSNGGTTSINSALCKGLYELTVTDANGCSTTASSQIGNQAPSINLSMNVINSNCGMCDGSASLTATGGNGRPFTFIWPTIGMTGSSIGGLCAGIYPVEVRDNQGCIKSFQVNVNDVGGPTLTDSIVDVSCFGQCDGKAIITANGKAPISYFWSDSSQQNTDTAFNLCSGNYSVIVSDSDGCITTRNVAISEPTPITNTFNYLPISCPGDSGGLVSMVSGGLPPYTYLWSTNPKDTFNLIDSIPSGTYSITITDSNNCSIQDTAILTDPLPMGLTFSTTPVLCFGACNATATVNVTGGRSPYNYSWDDPNMQADKRAIGLCSGIYRVTVTDANGCSVLDSVTLVEPGSVSLSFVPTNPSCTGDKDGSINITPSGGVPPFSYIWSNGQKNNPATSLGAGEYSVVVIDANGCTAYDTILLNNPSPLTATFNRTRPQCDSANGSIQAVPMGGSGNYSYIWQTIPTQNGVSANGLNAGKYGVTIIDNVSGCEVDYDVILNNLGAPTLTLTVVDESCFGACNGSIMATAASIVDYQWDDPSLQKTATANGLCSGTYTVTVTDTGGCKSTDTATVKTTIINSVTDFITNPSCFGNCDGQAGVITIGGKIPYNYSWNTNPVQTGNTAMNLCSGSYNVSTTDSNSCVVISSVLITDPPQLAINTTVLSGLICNMSCDGEAEVSASGGTPPYTFSWSHGSSGKNVKNLCAGVYSIIVTDKNGCMANDTIEILSQPGISANAIIKRPTCGLYDGQISLNPSGGSLPYTYNWSTGQSTAVISNLFAGIYKVTITDGKGCSINQTYFLNNPNAPNLIFGNNTVKCTGDCNGIASVRPSGGVAPYSYIWDYTPTSFTDSLKDLCTGAYSVKVTDALGCISFGNDTITEPLPLVVAPVVDDPGCGGVCEGEATANPSGGTAPYRYSWNTVPPTTSNTATDLCTGSYNVMVTDTNDCVSSGSVSISPPPPLVVDSITSVAATCNDNTDGQAAVYISGGTMPYSYFWNDGNITQIIPNTRGGTRIVQVTDANGCEITDTVEVGILDTVTVDAVDDFSACFGQEIELSAIGKGVTSYQWFEVTGSAINQVGNDSVITVTLIDTTLYVIRGSNNSSPPCVFRDTVIVTGIPAPVVDAGPDETITKGESTILDNVTPFIPQGFYFWNPGTGLDDSTVIRPRANPNETTTYVLTIIDEFGCSNIDTITVFVVDKNIVFNGISPNGDGVNDVWTIELIEEYPDAIVEVYNRWGQQVFRSVGYKEKWDGTYKGDALPSGTYYYVIDLQVEGTETLTGPITILR